MKVYSLGQKILSGDAIVSRKARKYYKLVALLVAFVIFYIFMGYRAMKQQHHLSDLKNEVRDKKFEYLTISAQRMNTIRQSAVAQKLRENGSNIQENQKALLRIE